LPSAIDGVVVVPNAIIPSFFYSLAAPDFDPLCDPDKNVAANPDTGSNVSSSDEATKDDDLLPGHDGD
jgi:hypothetical protein